MFNFYLNQNQSLELYWKWLLHLLWWGNLVKNKNTLIKCRFQLGSSKYNRNKKQKFKQNLLTQWFLGFIATRFFNRHQVFLNFQEKQAVGEFSGRNFNCTSRLHLALLIRNCFDKSSIYPEIQAARILIKNKSSSEICSTPITISNTTTIYNYYVFSFFKLKTEVIID